MENKITFYIDSIAFETADMLYKIKIYFGYLLYLIDTLNEKIYDKLMEKAMKLNGGEFVKKADRIGMARSYGLSTEIFSRASGYASDFADYDENRFLWRSYYGYGLFYEIFKAIYKRVGQWLDRPLGFSILLLAVLFAALVSLLFFFVP